MSLPAKCVVDTNVPKVANLAIQPDPGSDVPDTCVEACVDAIRHVVRTCGLVLDAGNEIYDEYMRQLAISKQPGMGDRFMKWVNDHRWNFDVSQRVPITRSGDSYDEFPVTRRAGEFRQVGSEICRGFERPPGKAAHTAGHG